MSRRPIVTIDGPAGAGKTTVAKAVAERTGLTLLDTGAMYRVVALAAKRAGIPWTEAEPLGRLTAALSISFARQDGRNLVRLDGEDVTAAIRTPDMGMGASAVSAHLPVRRELVAQQRRIAEHGGIVAEGRDVGTAVFPNAQAKFFLDAAAAVRARRRIAEWKGPDRPPFEDVLRDVLRRDMQDSTREHSPLTLAADMTYVDSTTMTPAEVVALIAAAVAPQEA